MRFQAILSAAWCISIVLCGIVLTASAQLAARNHDSDGGLLVGLGKFPPAPQLPDLEKSLSIGIIFDPKTAPNIFTSGRYQVPFNLADLLRQGDRHSVYLVDLSDDANKEIPIEYGNITDLLIPTFSQALSLNLDLWIVSDMTVTDPLLEKMKASGGKVIAVVTDSYAQQQMDAFIFDHAPYVGFPPSLHYDAIFLPGHHKRHAGYFETMTQIRPAIVPFIYSPRYYDVFASIITKRPYFKKTDEKRVAVMEPNLNVGRTCIVPLSAMELLYRKDPNAFDHLFLTNAAHLGETHEFQELLRDSITIPNDDKMSIRGRFKTPWFLSQHTDVVLAHQWDDTMNYLYLDVMHAGYPLVHNSPDIKECGFYYEENDAVEAARLVEKAFSLSPGEIAEMQMRYQRCLWEYSYRNEANLHAWEQALYHVLRSPRPKQRQLPVDTSTATKPTTSTVPSTPTPSENDAPSQSVSPSATTSAAASAVSQQRQQPLPPASLKPPLSRPVPPFKEPATGWGNLRLNRALERPKKSYKIGLTTSITPEAHSIYAAGIMQLVFYIYDMLTFEGRHEAVLVNMMKGERSDVPEDWNFDDSYLLVNFENSLKLPLDMYIEVGMQLTQENINRIQLKGAKVISYRGGNDRIMSEERFIFDHGGSSPLFNVEGIDAVWTLPSFYKHGGGFLETAYKAPVFPAPYVWNPRFFDHAVKALDTRKYWTPRGKHVVGIFESNFHIVKNAIIPLTITEHLHRQDKTMIDKVIVGCSTTLLKNKEFNNFVLNTLELYPDARLNFVGRVRLPLYLSDNIDVIVSHQWANEHNYLYLDVMHAGYPLVHNSEEFKECGYYYPENDAFEGARQLRLALTEHNATEYRQKALLCLWRYHTNNEDNNLGWDALMDEVMSRPRTPERLALLKQWEVDKANQLGPRESPVGVLINEKIKKQEAQLAANGLLAPQRRYTIAMTISIPKDAASIFSNGAKQTAFYLWEMFTYLKRHDVYFVNLDAGNASTIGSDWGLPKDLIFLTFDEALPLNIDIWMEVGMQMSERQMSLVQAKGAKVITYRTGNDIVMASEAMLFDKDRGSMLNTKGQDEVWTLPAFYRARSFLRTLWDVDVKEMPFVWTPFFFDNTAKLADKRRYYTPRAKEKVVGVFESNLHVVKSSVIPMVILEKFYRAHPELLKAAKVTNALSLSKQPEFAQYVDSSFSIYKDGKAEFLGRFKLPWYLGDSIDVVLSHQWGNAMNYLYFDTMWAGYPLVHNSHFLTDCGWYYPVDDGNLGAEALFNASTTFDSNIDAIYEQYAECIWRHSNKNIKNINIWEQRIRDVLLKPMKDERRQEIMQWAKTELERLQDKEAPPVVSAQSTSTVTPPAATATEPTHAGSHHDAAAEKRSDSDDEARVFSTQQGVFDPHQQQDQHERPAHTVAADAAPLTRASPVERNLPVDASVRLASPQGQQQQKPPAPARADGGQSATGDNTPPTGEALSDHHHHQQQHQQQQQHAREHQAAQTARVEETATPAVPEIGNRSQEVAGLRQGFIKETQERITAVKDKQKYREHMSQMIQALAE